MEQLSTSKMTTAGKKIGKTNAMKVDLLETMKRKNPKKAEPRRKMAKVMKMKSQSTNSNSKSAKMAKFSTQSISRIVQLEKQVKFH